MNKHTHTTIVLSELASMLNAHVKRGNYPWILAHAKQCEQNLVILFFLYLFFLAKLLLSNFRSRGHFHNTIIWGGGDPMFLVTEHHGKNQRCFITKMERFRFISFCSTEITLFPKTIILYTVENSIKIKFSPINTISKQGKTSNLTTSVGIVHNYQFSYDIPLGHWLLPLLLLNTACY